MFSFSRIAGADPMLGVEMTSTGEVGCLGADLNEALLHGLLATGFRFPTAGVLLSLGPIADKYSFADEARMIVEELGLPVYATKGTAERLIEVGVDCVAVDKGPGGNTSALDLIDEGKVDLVINIPREYDEQGRPDGYLIRRRAVDAGIPLITDLKLAGAVVEALRSKRPDELGVVAWGEYMGRRAVPLG
jgi:carbamoyl-phosphate synthase large subunit